MVLLMKSNLGVPLTINQVRYVMNQEILSNGIATNGKNTSKYNYFEWNQRSTLVKSKGLLSMSTYTFTNAKGMCLVIITSRN
jgi:hypothetical protein